MRLNRLEFALMNNPIRASIQKRIEAPRLRRMGGAVSGGTALEIGCGRGVGTEIILDQFDADRVDAFDLDPRMMVRARTRLSRRGGRVRLWAGDATGIATPAGMYDAVFDFGIIHHIPEWRSALADVYRVLKPGGRFYAEEALAPVIRHSRHFLEHPQHDRFTARGFLAALAEAGLEVTAHKTLGHAFAWFIARKPA